MHHSYEGLDRPGGFSRVRMLTPLRHRDFRLLWGGMCVSLLGDGIVLVAMAWQVYALSDAPTALSLVGIAMTVPTIAFLLLGGVVSDRFDRRRVMLAADLAPARPSRCSPPCRSPARSRSGTSPRSSPSTARARRSPGPRSTLSCPTYCRPASWPGPTRST